ncbi:hypothetical protein FB645_002947 [Coemansia sp. IMI 203386]|nr:hypothetical protein FB645_002947 [Coemansia sp. IMI 203386]
MAHIDTTTVRSRLPRLPLSGIPGISRTGSHQHLSHQRSGSQQLHYSQQQKQLQMPSHGHTQVPHTATAVSFNISSNLSQDSEKSTLAPSKEKSVVFVYGGTHASTVVFLESMLGQLLAKCVQSGWSYGVLLSDHTLTPRDRILVNGQTVSAALFEKCTDECRRDIDDKRTRISPRGASVKERQNAMLANIALRVFSSQNVSLVVVAVPDPGAGTASTDGADDADESGDAACCVEKMIMAMHGPRSVVCGVEALPAYADGLPDGWRRSLLYLMHRRAHLVSSAQPKAVRMQLLGLAKANGLTVDLAQPLSSMASTKDLQVGSVGAEQPGSAALALALCQTWAYQSGVLRQRTLAQGVGEYAVSMALRQQSKLALPASPLHAQAQAVMRDTPQWMVRGLAGARSAGLFDSVPAQTGSRANWHYSWAETPADFARAGEWFSGARQDTNPCILLIHLPESFISTVRHQRNGQWLASDYRDMLRALYQPLRSVRWACCVFAAGVLNELNVMESSVPPVLSQYVLREFWSQLSGQPTDQIFIAPSLAGAFRMIASASTTRLHAATGNALPPADSASSMASPDHVASRSAYFEPPATPRMAHGTLQPSSSTTSVFSLQPSSSTTSIFSLATRPQRALSKASVLKNATSVDNLRESRRKFSLGISTLGSESTTSLPLRTPKVSVPLTAPMAAATTPASAPKVDILVTGAKSFVHSTMIFANKQAVAL